MSLKEFSLFLALDTSFETGSAGLFQAEERPLSTPQQKIKTLAFRKWSVQRQSGKTPPLSHSEKLIPEILSILQETKKDLSHLKFLAVNVGPGRFTGVRTSANVARTLSFSLKIPCYPLNSLRIAAESFLKKSSVITVAFNGFKNSVYFAEFSSGGKELTAPCVLPFPKYLEQIKNKSLCVGDVPRFYDIPSSLRKSCKFKETELSVKNSAQIIMKEFHSQSLIPWFQLQPLYLREDIAKEKK